MSWVDSMEYYLTLKMAWSSLLTEYSNEKKKIQKAFFQER